MITNAVSATTIRTPNTISNLIIIFPSFTRSHSVPRAVARGFAIREALATARGTDLFERPHFYLSNEWASLRSGFGRKRKIKLWNIAKCLAENSAYVGGLFPSNARISAPTAWQGRRYENPPPAFGLLLLQTSNSLLRKGMTMQTEMLEKTIEVRDQLGAEVKRAKEAVADVVDDGVVAAGRAVKQSRRAAEDLIDDAECRVKQHPFSALGVSFGIGMGLGAAIGALLARNSRCGR